MSEPQETGSERQGWEYECFECGYEEESVEDSPVIPLRECPECSDGKLHHVGPVVDQCDECGADLLYNGNAGLGGYHEETLCDNCYDRRQSLVTDGGIDRHEWIQKQLAKLDMVQWDRFTVGEDAHGERFVNVYGWIEREHDEYKDFVLLMFWPELGENGILGYTTSSDDHTREIHRRLFGDEPGHNDCQRVEHTFEIDNAVELDPTEQRTLTDGGEPQETGTEHGGFQIRGIVPTDHKYDFEVSVDAEFAERLESLHVPEKQQNAAEHITETCLSHEIARLRFVGDSFLLRGMTVGLQATDLNLHKEEMGRRKWATHNVDSPSEAVEIVAAFSRWEELARTVLRSEKEDDEKRAVHTGTSQSGGDESDV